MRTLFASLLFLATSAVAQTAKIRTDGYYYWNNGRTEIIPLQLGPATVAAKTGEIAYLYGLISGTRDEIGCTCFPIGVIPKEGSSYSHYIAFFTNSEGTVNAEACNDSTTVQRTIYTFLERRKGRDGRKTVARQELRVKQRKNDSLFMVSGTDFYFQEHYSGRIVHDGLDLKVTRVAAPSDDLNHRNVRRYRFYRYDQIPAFPSR